MEANPVLGADQSSDAPGAHAFRRTTWCALLLLGATLGLRLGRAELTIAEAWHAEVALGPDSRDYRAPAPAPAHRALAAWASVVGTTERSLRLAVVLLAVIAAAALGRAAARAHGPAAEPWPALVLAASPILNRGDLLHAGLLGIVPVALVLGLLAPPGRRVPWPLLSGVAGGFLCGLLGGRFACMAVAILAAAFGVHRRPSSAAASLAAAGAVAAGTLARGQGWAWPLADLTAPGEPGSLDAAQALILLGPLLAAALWSDPGRRRRSLLALGATLAAGAALAAVPGEGSRGRPGMDVLACVLPTLAWVLAATVPGLARARRAVVLGALLGLALVPAALSRRADPPRPMRDALDRARDVAPSGSRLIAWGDSRFGLLHYARRGHGPGVPIILVPEEVAFEDLGASLEERLGAAPGVRTPAVLLHPIPPTLPPGLVSLGSPGADLLRATLAEP